MHCGALGQLGVRTSPKPHQTSSIRAHLLWTELVRAEPMTYSIPSANIVPGGIWKIVDAYKHLLGDGSSDT